MIYDHTEVLQITIPMFRRNSATTSKTSSVKPSLKTEECIDTIRTVQGCCKKRGQQTNCFLNCFLDSETEDVNWSHACTYLREIRALSETKNSQELSMFAAEMFNKSVTGEKRMANGELKYEHNFTLPRGQSVCRKVFGMAYGFSKDDLSNCSNLRKLSGNNRIAYKKHFTSYTDGFLSDQTHFEVSDMFLHNVGVIGK